MDKKKIILGIIYVLVAFLFTALLPGMLSFNNDKLAPIMATANWVKPAQLVVFVMMLLIPAISLGLNGSGLGSLGNKKVNKAYVPCGYTF